MNVPAGDDPSGLQARQPKPGQVVGAEALVAVVAWGSAFQACELYYRTLGTSTSEVGLSVTAVLANLAALLLALTPSAWIAVVGWSLCRRRSADLALFCGLVAFVVAFIGTGVFVGHRFGVPVLSFLGALLLLISVVNVDVAFGRHVSRSFPVFFGVVLTGGLALCLFTMGTASDDAARLDVQGRPHGFSSVFNLYARPACLEPLAESAMSVPTDVAQLVLGARDGMAVVRDVRTGETRRIPEALVEFRSVRSAGAPCELSKSASATTTTAP